MRYCKYPPRSSRGVGIVRVPGVDALMIGPYDLSGTMGKLCEANDPEMQQAMETVRSACAAAGMKLGIFAATAERMEPYIQKGYTLPIAGMGLMLLAAAARGMVQALKLSLSIAKDTKATKE